MQDDQTMVAVDAAARGPYAAFGAVILCAGGVRLEVNGPLPRTGLQEVTAALMALRYVPADSGSVTVYTDAHGVELQAVLAVTHPGVQVQQILRNSIPEHERAHVLAQAARKKLELNAGSVPEEEINRIAVYSLQSVDQGQPRYAVVFWEGKALRGYTGSVATQASRVLTRKALEEAVAQHVSPQHVLIQDLKAHPKFMDPGTWVNAAQLKVLRKKSRGLLLGQPLTGPKEGSKIEFANGDDPVSTGLAESEVASRG